MKARDWFESIRADVVEMNNLEYAIMRIEAQAGPHGQQAGSIGGGGNRDSMRGIDSLVDSGARERLERMQRKTNPRITEALAVLYGRSGNGGLAKAKRTVDADILCGYYLQGLDWPQVAAQLSGFNPSRPNGWARMRAMRALSYIDRVGAEALADS